jgi:hypothetical protein
VGDITLMAHFADAEKPDGIAGAMARINHASEGLIARVRCPTPPPRFGTRKLTATGCAPASCCMARPRPGSGRMWLAVASNRS